MEVVLSRKTGLVMVSEVPNLRVMFDFKKLKNYIIDNAFFYVSLFFLSAFFLLIFSLWTSPAYHNWYGCDASFFTMAGRGITEGWVPYRDFFDLKGPYFFFLEALGQLLCKGRSGAYIIQVFALFFALIFMIKTCRLFISVKKTGFIVAIFLFFYASTLWGGNTLEEYALPLNLLVFYLILKDVSASYTNMDHEISADTSFINIKNSSALISGVCFAIILFSKVTVAAPIIGLILAVIIYYLKDRRFFDLALFILYAFLGLLIGITPIFIYFYSKGMLSEMLYAVFLFAFKRSVDFGTKFSVSWELKISGCYFAIIYVLCQLKTRKNVEAANHVADVEDVGGIGDRHQLANNCPLGDRHHSQNFHRIFTKGSGPNDFMLTSVLLAAVITALVLHLGDPFIYYFTTAYPIIMLTFISIFVTYDPLTLFKDWRLDVPIVAFLICLCYFASHTANQLNTVLFDRGNTYYQDYVDEAMEMASLIPEDERDDVYSINLDMQWFECNQILPCYSYTINLQFFVDLDPRIEQNIIRKLNNDPPKWIVTGGDIESYLPNINDVVQFKYKNIYGNSYGSLYILTE